MAAPVIQTADTTTATTGGSTATTLSINAPANISDGDLLVIVAGNDDTTSNTQFTDDPVTSDGFTKADEAGNTTSDSHVAVFYKVSNGTENATFNIDCALSPGDEAWAICYRITGADTTSPLHIVGTKGTANTRFPSAASISTTVDDCLALAVFAFDGGDIGTVSSSSSGWSKDQQITSGTSGNDASGWVYTKSMSGQGATGNCLCDVQNPPGADGCAYFQITFAPASGITITADAGSFSVSGVNANLEHGREVSSNAGSFAISGVDANLEYGREITADAGSFTVSGSDASLEFGFEVLADAGSFNLTGVDATLDYSGDALSIIADAGSFLVSGNDANLEYGYEVSAVAGAFSINGSDANLEYGFEVNADAGSFSISGVDANLEFGAEIAADAGSFTISGVDAILDYSGDELSITADQGSFAISGTDANLEYGREISADAGTFSISGSDVTFTLGLVISADAGSFSITGSDASFLYTKLISVDSNAFGIVGSDAVLLADADLPTLEITDTDILQMPVNAVLEGSQPIKKRGQTWDIRHKKMKVTNKTPDRSQLSKPFFFRK